MPSKPNPSVYNFQNDFDAIGEIFAEIASEAAVAVMRIYRSDSNARSKPDMSPVCDADEYAEAIILERLRARLPNVPILAEEASAHGDKPLCGACFILVDPVDGTQEFLNHNGEFTINIALIVDGVPRVGVVYAPALERLWIAGQTASVCTLSPGEAPPPASKRHEIHVRRAPEQGLTALASRSHSNPETEAFLSRLPIKERQSAGSSLKFCRLAEGTADVYPRFGNTMEWDTAAGDAILRAAGGVVLDTEKRPLHYGKSQAQFKNGHFIAWGDPAAIRD